MANDEGEVKAGGGDRSLNRTSFSVPGVANPRADLLYRDRVFWGAFGVPLRSAVDWLENGGLRLSGRA